MREGKCVFFDRADRALSKRSFFIQNFQHRLVWSQREKMREKKHQCENKIVSTNFRFISSFACLSLYSRQYEELAPNENKNNAIVHIKINIFHHTYIFFLLNLFVFGWLIQQSLHVQLKWYYYALMRHTSKNM